MEREEKNTKDRKKERRGDLISGVSLGVEEFLDLHLDEILHFDVGGHVALVEEDDDGGDTDLSGEENVFAGLGHRAVGGADDEDGAVELGGSGNHVLEGGRVREVEERRKREGSRRRRERKRQQTLTNSA